MNAETIEVYYQLYNSCTNNSKAMDYFSSKLKIGKYQPMPYTTFLTLEKLIRIVTDYYYEHDNFPSKKIETSYNILFEKYTILCEIYFPEHKPQVNY